MTYQQLTGMASSGTFLVVILLVAFGVAMVWAVLNDEADAHLYHGPTSNCADCQGK